MTATPYELLERDRELAALERAFGADGTGPVGGLLAIEGRAGMGKTRLLTAARDAAARAGLRVLYARGSVLERSFAFGVVRQLFEPILRRSSAEERRDILAGAAGLALPLLEAAPVESGTRPNTEGALSALHGLYWLAFNLAEAGPLLLAVDDLHWSDTSSLDWLGYLVRRLEGLPIVIAVALRPDEPGMESVLVNELTSDPLSTVLRLQPLSAEATSRLIEHVLQDAPEDAFARACLEASGGNPLLLSELVQALRAEGVVPDAANLARVQEIGPAAVSRSVRLRLSHLTPPAQTFAQALAVLSDGADLELVTALAGIDRAAAADAAETLERVGIITSEPELAFVHPLVREAVYQETPRAQRGEAHRKAAEILADRGEPPERAAAHLLLTPRAFSASAVTTLRKAAHDALARTAAATAAVYLSRALDEPPTPEERAAILYELGSAEALLRDPDAEDHLREALELTADPTLRADMQLALARLLFWRNATGEAVALLEGALRELTPQHRELQTALEAELAGIALTSPVTHAVVAERLSHLEDAADESVAGKTLLGFAAFRDMLRGEARNRCIDRAREALAGGALLEREVTPSLVAVAVTLFAADEPGVVMRLAQQARSLAEARGAPTGFALASAAIARVYHDKGSLFEAEAFGAVGLEACPQNEALAKAYVVATMAWVHLKRGDLAAAEASLSRADLDRSHVPTSLHAANPLSCHGFLHLAQGKPEAALEDFRAVGELMEPAGCRNPAFAPWRSGTALALMQLGEREEARRLAEEEVELARSWGAPTAIGRSLRALGLVEGGKRSLELLQEAASVLERSPAGYELLATQVELGAALRRTNQRAAARATLRDCLDRASRSGAGLLAKQAGEELLATGARPRRAVLSGAESLTASERRVAMLAGQGKTNREIAQSLFVTTKTVEMHLAHAFGKLGIRSRTELPDHLGA